MYIYWRGDRRGFFGAGLSLKKSFLFLKIDINKAINIKKPPTGKAEGKNIIPTLKKISPFDLNLFVFSNISKSFC